MPHFPQYSWRPLARVIELDIPEESCLDSAKFSLKLDYSSGLAIVVNLGVVHGEDSNAIFSRWRDMSHPDFGKQRRISAHNHFLDLDSSNSDPFDEIFHVLIELEVIVDQDPEVLAFINSGDPVSAKLKRGLADGIITSVEDLMVRLIFVYFEAL